MELTWKGSLLALVTMAALSSFPAGLKAAECDGVGWPVDLVPVVEPFDLPSQCLGLEATIEFPVYWLPAIDTQALLDEDDANAALWRRIRSGINRSLDEPLTGNWHDTPDGGRLWTAAIVTQGALRLRLHLTDVDLPSNARLYIYSPEDPAGGLGPYADAGPHRSGDFWAGSVAGDTAYIEYYVPNRNAVTVPFHIDELGHMYRDTDWDNGGDDRGDRSPLDCMGDVACYPDWESVSYSVARIEFYSNDPPDPPGWYFCTGQLLATVNADRTPYFLTSAHCIDEQSEAESLEYYWFYQRATCGGAFMPIQYGYDADLLATSGATIGADWALLMVTGVLPSGVFWSGWTSATPASGTWSVGVHHPDASWKRYSRGRRYSYNSYYDRLTFNVSGGVGTIYFGSSGSGIWRESDQKLFGNCSWVSSPYAGCDYMSTFGGYGRFSTYYASISSLLAAGSDDRLEQNDSCAGAAPLANGTYNDLVVKSVDEDWYRANLANGGALLVDIYFTDAHGNINLQLYDSCGGSVVASATSYTNNEYLNYTNAGPAGDFYLRVYLFDDVRNTYDMTCTITGVTEVKRPDPWEFDEYGGSCQQDSDCWGPSETVAYCVPDDGGTFPGTCYAPANRYLSIARDPEQAENTARRITRQSGGAGPWWVGPPTYSALEDMYFASVSATSVYAGIDSGNWVSGDWPQEIHVKGCEIAPGQTYEVQAIPHGANEADEGSYSEALDLKTAPIWGDIVSTCAFDHCLPPEGTVGQPSIDDVLAVVNAFTGTRNAPLTWLDIDPVTANGEPEGLWVLIGDVLATVNAYTGGPYPGNGPLGCP